MAFLYQITSGLGGQPVLNFANQQNNCTLFDGTELVNCPDVGEDITICQQKYGKTILLSIGGATYTEAGFTSEDAAVAAAQKLWAIFGPQQYSSSALRPFGNAIVDGEHHSCLDHNALAPLTDPGCQALILTSRLPSRTLCPSQASFDH